MYNTFKQIFYGEMYALTHIMQAPYSLKKKSRIFIVWLKINITFFLLVKLLGLKLHQENILGYKITAFDYATLRFLFEEIFCRGQYAIHLQNQSNPIIFDLGANIGMATIFFVWMYPASQIYAFEPNKETFLLLQKNISQNNLQNVHLYNYAVSNHDGQVDFFVDTAKKGSLNMSEYFERMSKDAVRVSTISLAHFIKEKSIKHIDLVKMDIEGSEKKVIYDLDAGGMIPMISHFIIEYHHKISLQKSSLAEFLAVFEKNNFEYQIDASGIPFGTNQFQDVLLYVYKNQ